MSVENYYHNLHTVYFMCDSCFKVVRFDNFNVHISFQENVNIKNPKFSYLEFTPHQAFQMKCNDCEDGIFVMIDPLIVENIVNLNTIGLLTEYSCEGHYIHHDRFIQEPHYAPPYVKFFSETTPKLIELKCGIPKGWECSILDGGVRIGAKDFDNETPFNKESFKLYQKEKLDALTHWIWDIISKNGTS